MTTDYTKAIERLNKLLKDAASIEFGTNDDDTSVSIAIQAKLDAIESVRQIKSAKETKYGSFRT